MKRLDNVLSGCPKDRRKGGKPGFRYKVNATEKTLRNGWERTTGEPRIYLRPFPPGPESIDGKRKRGET